MVPNARFLELLADIEPSPTTVSNASCAHNAVRDHLQSHDTFGDRWEGDFLAGSYARDTAIRPKRSGDGYERPDVDIIMVTNYSTSDRPDDVLQDVADALEPDFGVERINKRSVRVITPQAEIDVVPVVEDGNAYQLPDRDLGYWKGTNPPGHNDWSRDTNVRLPIQAASQVVQVVAPRESDRQAPQGVCTRGLGVVACATWRGALWRGLRQDAQEHL